MTKEIIYSDATKLAELIRTREVSPVEVVQAHLDRIAAVNPKINAIVTLADGALEAAKAAEAAVLAGDELGPLHGVPFTVKDGLGTDLAISVRGPAAQTGITSMKATHGRVPMTGIWPRAPRRFWHVGPMARSVRDIALAFSQLVGPDGQDAFATSTVQFDAGIGRQPYRQLRVGWMVGPGFGPVDPEVAATVKAAAEALKDIGVFVVQVSIPALERDFPLDVFNRLHVMEMKPAFAEATAGHQDEMYKMAKTMLSLPDTSMKDYIDAEQAVERLRDGYADYFSRYDALITHVLPIPAHKHGVEEFKIDGQTVDATYLQGATVPLNVTGLPGLSMRFGTSKEGLPINVQVVGKWQAESTILHLASLLESISTVRNLHPNL